MRVEKRSEQARRRTPDPERRPNSRNKMVKEETDAECEARTRGKVTNWIQLEGEALEERYNKLRAYIAKHHPSLPPLDTNLIAECWKGKEA